MPRHIDLRHYLDPKTPAVFYDLFDLRSAVISSLRLIGVIIPEMISAAHGTDLMELRIAKALNAPSLVVRDMPVEII